jgi:hypothetical protein
MHRRMGLTVAAVVLSLTLGVLVGLVIHTGMQQRADRDPTPSSPAVTGTVADERTEASDPADGVVPGESSDAESAPADTGPPAGAVPVDDTGTSRSEPPVTSTRTVTVTPSGTATSAARTSPATSTARTSSPTGRTTTSSSRQLTIVRTTVTAGTSASGTRSLGTGATTGTAGTTPATTSAAAPSPHPGKDSPDGRCSKLGEKSSTASGATLYCQHDQQDGTLRWRAVTDGGGCLNRTMTGIGLDGHRYACRIGAGGLNHWVRVG